MKSLTFFLVVLSVLLVASGASAAVLFTDGFESYTAGGNPLDKNVTGPNSAANGSGNPWFGPAPPNARVVGTDSFNGSSVSPHSGNNMIRASAASDLDQNWYNLAYRQNGGSAFTGNVQFDWWFYDPIGQGTGSTNFRDYAAVGYYNTAPGTTDYPGTGSLNTGATQIQRLGLGTVNGNAASPDGLQCSYCGRRCWRRRRCRVVPDRRGALARLAPWPDRHRGPPRRQHQPRHVQH